MEPKVIDRAVTKFQLNLPSEVRAQLEEYVATENERVYPAKLTMTDVINAAVVEYIDRRTSDKRAA